MSDPRCVIGADVKLIEKTPEGWVLDGAVYVSDISDCIVMPSPHDRRIVVSVLEKKPLPPKAKTAPPPAPLISAEKEQPVTPPPYPQVELVEEVVEVVQDTLLDKLGDKLGENMWAVGLAIGFTLLKRLISQQGQQASKAQEEMDKKCKGRHSDSESYKAEMEARIKDLTEQLQARDLELKGFASRQALKATDERLKALYDEYHKFKKELLLNMDED